MIFRTRNNEMEMEAVIEWTIERIPKCYRIITDVLDGLYLCVA